MNNTLLKNDKLKTKLKLSLLIPAKYHGIIRLLMKYGVTTQEVIKALGK